jgi:4-aminobutyrate aminotransferase
MSIGGSKAVHHRGFGPLAAGVHRAEYDCKREELERLFAQVAPPDEVAAIFVEPILGEGGYRIPSAGFLPMLRDVCDRHGILLVADEIQSGIGRTGRMFACQHTGVVPDMICIAKGIASGMPLGALVTRADVMTWPPGSHASTFGGNPVCCRAALATLDLVEREYMDNARRQGELLRTQLAEIASAGGALSDVRGLGLMVAADVADAGKPNAARRDALVQAAFHRGLLLLGCGPASVRFAPALCVTEAQVRTAVSIVRALVN